MTLPADRSTETHRIVAIDPHNPVHQAIVSNPGGSNVAIKDGYLHFPKPNVRGAETSPAAPIVKEKPAPKPKPKPKPVKEVAPAPVRKKKSEPVKTGMASLADKNRARELADARRNAILRAKKLGK